MNKEEASLSALQLHEGLRRKADTYAALLISVEGEKQGKDVTPKVIKQLLEGFKDTMASELLKELPPKRDVDHAIEMIPGINPLTQEPYRMPPAHLEEL